jgi:hypothetical protein
VSPLVTATVHGQDSYLLRTDLVSLAVTAVGGMLSPVIFFPNDSAPISPYAVAPWAEEPLPPGIPPMLAALRGDWVCSAFGENVEPHGGHELPPHGETANRRWRALEHRQSAAGCWMRLSVDLPLQGGHCESMTALLNDHSVVYQRHDFGGLTGPFNPGHHATLAMPNAPGSGLLSFSPHRLAWTYLEPTAKPEDRGYSWLKPDSEIRDLHAVPCIDGSTTDLCRYPSRRGYEDLAIVCANPDLDIAWSAVTVPDRGYVWFSLRNPKLLASTLLWFSNGGRHFPPWNGRHINVLALEDVTAFFHVGLAASCRRNFLNERGVRTFLEPDEQGCVSIPYIQGVARIPARFDCVAQIDVQASSESVTLTSKSGERVTLGCQHDFLRTGTLDI